MTRLRPRLAWIRYGGPIADQELDHAVGKYRVAILQPWETAAAARLKAENPGITVLAYQCLSSVRTYEPGPIFSSGLSAAQAEEWGTFAERENGIRVEWEGYPGHFQQKVWDPGYRRHWVDSVVDRFTGSPFDGVMADNDVFDDYYGLRLPLRGGVKLPEIRTGLDELITEAGNRLEEIGKVLVPNLAEARRETDRWERHSRFGGGFEECWMGWGTQNDQWLREEDVLAQVESLTASGLSIARVPGTGEPGDPYLLLALAAAWVFAPDSDVAVTATAVDGYSASPYTGYEQWDLGYPLSSIWDNPFPGVYTRSLTHGFAAVNLSRETVEVDFDGSPVIIKSRRGTLLPLGRGSSPRWSGSMMEQWNQSVEPLG